MSKLRFTFQAFVFVVVTLAFASFAQAQASRTWVSGVGDDVNPCSRTAPCKTFAGAISKTATNGEINCLDPGGFGGLTITKSITVDCHEVFAGVLHSSVNGFNVNFDQFSTTSDPRKSVRIRNINFQGFDSGLKSVSITGGATVTGGSVAIEDCLMDGNLANVNPNGRGISDTRSGGGELFVGNTTIRNMGGSAIAVAPASGGASIHVSLNDVRIFNCAFGVVASSGSRVMANRVVASGCTNAGFFAEGLTAASELQIDNSVSSSNGTGVQNGGGGFGATIRVANSNFIFNTTAVTGTVLSYGNNRVSGGAGALTLISPTDTNPKGQQ